MPYHNLNDIYPSRGDRYLYALQLAEGNIYVGSTNNLERRLNQHFNQLKGASKWCKLHQPLSIISIDNLGESTAYRSAVDEMPLTMQMMIKHTWNKVRGGILYHIDPYRLLSTILQYEHFENEHGLDTTELMNNIRTLDESDFPVGCALATVVYDMQGHINEGRAEVVLKDKKYRKVRSIPSLNTCLSLELKLPQTRFEALSYERKAGIIGPKNLDELTILEGDINGDNSPNLNETKLQTRTRLGKNLRRAEYAYRTFKRTIQIHQVSAEQEKENNVLLEVHGKAFNELSKFEDKYYEYFLDGDGNYIDDGDDQLNDENFINHLKNNNLHHPYTHNNNKSNKKENKKANKKANKARDEEHDLDIDFASTTNWIDDITTSLESDLQASINLENELEAETDPVIPSYNMDSKMDLELLAQFDEMVRKEFESDIPIDDQSNNSSSSLFMRIFDTLMMWYIWNSIFRFFR